MRFGFLSIFFCLFISSSFAGELKRVKWTGTSDPSFQSEPDVPVHLTPLTLKTDSSSYVFDGGMMIHCGYLSGKIEALNYRPSGATFGIGGVARYHFVRHWRVGIEGYVSTLPLKNNGSYVKYGWGGALLDFYWDFHRVMPYIGFTVGGGSNTDLFMMNSPDDDWKPVDETYYNKKTFAFVDPYLGMDIIISRTFHITLKLDYLFPFNNFKSFPVGPRFYLGFLFYH